MSDPNWGLLIDGPPPPSRQGAYVAYDEARDEIVMFGGNTNVTGLLADTWTWDGVSWTEKFPTHSPGARENGAAAYDPTEEKVVIFGGLKTGPITTLDETWTWDGTDWTQESPGTVPSARWTQAMATAPGIGNVIMVGGRSSGGSRISETWSWDGTDWTMLSPANQPGNGTEMDTNAVYDRANNQVVQFGGNNGAAHNTQTHLWDGTDWTNLTISPNPGGHNAHGMAYLDCAERVVLWGGTTGGTEQTSSWLWDGVLQEWEEIVSASPPPGQLYPVLCGYESAGYVVLMSGDDDAGTSTGGDTYLFACGSTPPPPGPVASLKAIFGLSQ